MNHPIMFLDRDDPKVIASFFFLLFKNLMREKQTIAQKYVIVITVIISRHYKETN